MSKVQGRRGLHRSEVTCDYAGHLRAFEPSSARTQGAVIPGCMGATEDVAMRRFAAAAHQGSDPRHSLTSRRAEVWNQSSCPRLSPVAALELLARPARARVVPAGRAAAE